MIRGFMACILFSCFFKLAVAEIALLPINIDIKDHASLQRGATLFMNYCSGCHSLRYIRYTRVAKDLGLTTRSGDVDNNLLINNLIFTGAKPEDPIDISMPRADARQWFGNVPPDLSLAARERGQDWLYTYLKRFYSDKNRPFGANNLLVRDVAMPNILAPLQGTVIAFTKENSSQNQSSTQLILIKPGEMSSAQFDSALKDLVTFLVYVAEPAKMIRYRMGIFVILFLSIFLVVAYQLKILYWRAITKH